MGISAGAFSVVIVADYTEPDDQSRFLCKIRKESSSTTIEATKRKQQENLW